MGLEMEEDEDKHSRLYDNPAFSDITLKSANRDFHAHKVILNSKGGRWGVKDLRNHQLSSSCYEDKVVERILKWIYQGSCLVTIEDSQELKLKIFEAATKLSLTDAVVLCQKFIASRTQITSQIRQEIIKKGVIKACGTCTAVHWMSGNRQQTVESVYFVKIKRNLVVKES